MKPTVISGVNKLVVRDLRKYAKQGKCELGNLIEIMCCEGGCLGGDACLNAIRPAVAKVKGYSAKSFSLKDVDPEKYAVKE